MPGGKVNKEYFDLVVIIPLEQELYEFFKIFPSIDNRSTSTELLHVVDSGNPDLRMLVVQQQEMGRSSAANAVAGLIVKFDIGAVACIGIAGSLSKDMRLCDVCYSGRIIDVYDNTKVSDTDDGEVETELSPSQFHTPIEITSAFNYVRTQPHLKDLYAAWQLERGIVAESLFPLPVVGRESVEEKIGIPETLNGAIACGAVTKSESYNKRLRAVDRRLLAIETESGGIFTQAASKNLPAFTIRGISDYADRSKDKLEAGSAGTIRMFAAANAVSFLKLQLSNHYFTDYLRHRKSGAQTSFIIAESTESDLLPSTIGALSETIDTSLRKLSPEYKLQPKGYHLPIPRIRKLQSALISEALTYSGPLEIREALSTSDRVLINLPRTYPDQSVAWVIADDFLTQEINQKQMIPIVIDGNDIKSVRQNLKAASPIDLNKLDAIPNSQIVFIIDNVPLDVKHRLNLIVDEVESYKDAKFIFISRGDPNLVFQSDFVTRTGTTTHDACGISFLEISHFIQKNFSMSGSESEVIALRLRTTFKRFALDAHPTYFAGIPRETLTALLQANRRSELLQLAVDGFLTFLVAEDSADIALSRSTRSRFLKRLVVEMRVEKREFTQADLVAYTKEFADQYDFDIDPLNFISAFIEKGIIHFDNDRLEISLPFIGSYLLASQLAATPDQAKKYFRADDTNFDLATFDLYAEIGASESIIRQVLASLDGAINDFPHVDPADHILLNDTIAPNSMKKPDHAHALKKRLQQAAEDIQKNKDDSKDKQRLLDITEKVRAAAAKQSEEATMSESESEIAVTLKKINEAARHWAVATTLLGSGAERLDADTKRTLSKKIVRLAAHIIDDWTKLQTTIDFEKVKEDLLAEAERQQLETQSPEDTRKLISSLVDILELAALGEPFRRVVGHLCEQARHRVLATSVANTDVEHLFEKVMHATWLVDIDGKRGRQALRKAIKELPAAPFLRITLASHYLSRVYWNHWKKDDRLDLLDSADEVLKPISVRVSDKSELRRLIERDNRVLDDDLGGAEDM